MVPLILSVDDYEDDRLLSAFFLESLGYQSITAPDGETALALTQRYQPNLILLDLCLPGMNGLEVVRCLKQNPQTATIPVIAVTAMIVQGSTIFNASALCSREQALLAGCDDYVTKPYTLEEIESILCRHLSQSLSFS
uniref:response regulator n=1 Tax=Trichocoleus desertorum TaxID=1481672 RepID=UPI0025B3F72A|nr:response regulator [Trichocoleus desertorum]